MKKRGLLTLLELSAGDVDQMLARAAVLKKLRSRGKNPQTLKGKSLALIFEKPSTRTKVSFDVAMYELGGHAVSLESGSSQLGRGESYSDTGRVLSRYVHGIVMRTFGQERVQELASSSTIPVINGLSDLCHPCQVMTDLFTVQEFMKKKRGDMTVSFIGDGNNMMNSWIMAAILMKFPLRVATPKGFEPPQVIKEMIDSSGGKNILLTHDPVEAVQDADVVNTDTWFSMGQEVSEGKRGMFRPFQINRGLLKHAKKDAIVLHCLPAHCGEEITEEVMNGPQSRIWDQAENRLHVQKAILEMFLK